MEKVSEKWFKNLGFTKYEYKDVIDYQNHMGEVKTTTQRIFSISPDNKKWANFEHTYSVTVNKFGDKKVSNWYRFLASNTKTGFKVENNITHTKPTIEQIKSALIICEII